MSKDDKSLVISQSKMDIKNIESVFSGIKKYATELGVSPYTPSPHRNEKKAFYILQKGYELGLSPIQSLEQIFYINGKLATQVECMMAMVYRSNLMEDIKQTKHSNQ